MYEDFELLSLDDRDDSLDRVLLLLFSEDLDECARDLSLDLLVEDLSLTDLLVDGVEGRLDDPCDDLLSFDVLSFSFECLVDDDDDDSFSFECFVADDDDDGGSFSFKRFSDVEVSFVVDCFVVSDVDLGRSAADLASFSLLDFFASNVTLLSSLLDLLVNLLSSLDTFGLLRVSCMLSSLGVVFLLLAEPLSLSNDCFCPESFDKSSPISAFCRMLLALLGEGL